MNPPTDLNRFRATRFVLLRIAHALEMLVLAEVGRLRADDTAPCPNCKTRLARKGHRCPICNSEVKP